MADLKSISLVLLFTSFTFTANTVVALSQGAKILAFGDFGTGTPDQDFVAKAMIDFCARNGCDYGFTVGDNVYPRGIENLTNGKPDYDNGKPNFALATKYFVNRYRPLNMPIYMTYGNHDVGNESINVFKDFFKNTETINKRTLGLMKNAIAYTNHADNPIVKDGLGHNSRLYMFPAAFYSIPEKGNVSLWSIDTNSFPHDPLDTYQQLNKKMPKNYGQQEWLANSLKRSKATWKIVFGHQPIYSHGGHGWLHQGSIKEFRESIEDALCDNFVDFYVAGHDHHLEIDVHQCKNGHKVIAILTGAAAKQDRIYKRTFPFFGKDKNLIWANGKYYDGDKSIYGSDDFVQGFSYFTIVDDNTAIVRMALARKTSTEQTDACVKIAKGGGLTKVSCP